MGYFLKIIKIWLNKYQKLHIIIKSIEVIFLNEKSYTELMKKEAMKKKRLRESFVLDLYIDSLLTEVLLNREKERLMNQIDAAIDKGDQSSFKRLSQKYIELVKKFGN